MNKFDKILKGFTVVMLMTVLAKFASFVSELIIAYLLGTNEKADTYSMIIGIHQVIYPMLSVGIWSLFLPMYKKMLTMDGEKNANRLLSKVLTLFCIISIIVVIIIIIFAKQIVLIIANGFSEEAQILCTALLRIYSPYFIFVIISSVLAAALQSHEKFFASQLREFVTYLPTIFLGPIAYHYYDLYGLVFVLVIGSIFRLIVLLPFLGKKINYKIDLDFKTKEIKDMLKKMPSVLITSGIDQINTLIDKMMASRLIMGAVSGLSYGNKLINVFNGLFTSSISTASYPTISQYVANKNIEELKKLVTKLLITMAIIVIPTSILAIVLSKEIVTIVFARGQFNLSSVEITSKAFIGYLIGMYFIGVKGFINNVFYSFGETTKVMKISFISIIVNIFLNIMLTNYFGIIGLAIATSVSSIVYFFLTIIFLKRTNCIDYKKLIKTLIKIYLVSIIPVLIIILLSKILSIKNNIALVVIKSIIYMSMYLILLFGTKIIDLKKIIGNKKGDNEKWS